MHPLSFIMCPTFYALSKLTFSISPFYCDLDNKARFFAICGQFVCTADVVPATFFALLLFSAIVLTNRKLQSFSTEFSYFLFSLVFCSIVSHCVEIFLR